MDQQKPQNLDPAPKFSSPNKTGEKGVITFRPITDGLGFHPFSDGLPYAPIAKNIKTTVPGSSQLNSKPMGVGAEAAGRPRMIVPNYPKFNKIPEISVPVAQTKVSSQKLSSQLESKHKNNSNIHITEYSFGYLIKRLFSGLIDLAANLALFFGAMRLGYWSETSVEESLSNSGVLFVSVCLALGWHWLFVASQEVLFCTSLGKRLVGLRLPGSRSTIALRSVLFIPSFCFFGVGVLWSLLDPHRRCWHDQVSGIQPINDYEK